MLNTIHDIDGQLYTAYAVNHEGDEIVVRMRKIDSAAKQRLAAIRAESKRLAAQAGIPAGVFGQAQMLDAVRDPRQVADGAKIYQRHRGDTGATEFIFTDGTEEPESWTFVGFVGYTPEGMRTITGEAPE